MASDFPLEIKQGKTLVTRFRWATPPFVYLPIEQVHLTAPLRLTITGHDLKPGWPVAIVACKGQGSGRLNAQTDPPKPEDYRQAVITDQDTIEFNEVNGALISEPVTGGFIQFYSPRDLTGFSVFMEIRNRVGGDVLFTASSITGHFALDNDASLITLRIPPSDSEQFEFLRGVYDIEITDGTDTYLLAKGPVSVEREVTLIG